MAKGRSKGKKRGRMGGLLFPIISDFGSTLCGLVSTEGIELMDGYMIGCTTSAQDDLLPSR